MPVCAMLLRSALKKELSYMTLLEELSPHLRGVLALHCYGPVLSCVPYFSLDMSKFHGPGLVAAQKEESYFLQNVTDRRPPSERFVVHIR